ncbi:hypothetical protein AJ87_01965 [Rhizobium yanglingense]|nr:hypothetical protein AJ87_01965 [Rhizobium yanglingense]
MDARRMLLRGRWPHEILPPRPIFAWRKYGGPGWAGSAKPTVDLSWGRIAGCFRPKSFKEGFGPVSQEAGDEKPPVVLPMIRHTNCGRLCAALSATAALPHRRTRHMFDTHTVEIEWAGRPLKLETGKIARQADGAVLATYGETVVLATVVSAKAPKPGQDFFPLTVNYQEKTYAAGKIPGGYFKREGRPAKTKPSFPA